EARAEDDAQAAAIQILQDVDERPSGIERRSAALLTSQRHGATADEQQGHDRRSHFALRAPLASSTATSVMTSPSVRRASPQDDSTTSSASSTVRPSIAP